MDPRYVLHQNIVPGEQNEDFVRRTRVERLGRAVRSLSSYVEDHRLAIESRPAYETPDRGGVRITLLGAAANIVEDLQQATASRIRAPETDSFLMRDVASFQTELDNIRNFPFLGPDFLNNNSTLAGEVQRIHDLHTQLLKKHWWFRMLRYTGWTAAFILGLWAGYRHTKKRQKNNNSTTRAGMR